MRPPCPSASSQPAGRIIWAPRQASERGPCAPAFVQRARNTGQRSSIQLSLNGPTEIGGAGQLTLVATREQLDTTMLGSALPMVPCFGLERLLLSRESAQRSYLPIHRRAISKLIQVISPYLHHLDALQTSHGDGAPPDQLRSGRTEIPPGFSFPDLLPSLADLCTPSVPWRVPVIGDLCLSA